VNVADKINLTALEIVLIILIVLLFLSHITSFIIFIYWNVSKSHHSFSPSLFTGAAAAATDALVF